MPIILDTSTSTVTVDGTATSQGTLLLQENTGNGTSYVGLAAPASLASNVTFTLPSADGSNGAALVTNGSGTLSFGPVGISTGKSIAMSVVFGL